MMDYLYGIQTRRNKRTIKELIAMYAPTVLRVISVIMNYLKTFKELKKNVLGNKTETDRLKEEIDSLKEQLAMQAKDNLQLKVLLMENVNELKRVKKYDTDKEIQGA